MKGTDGAALMLYAVASLALLWPAPTALTAEMLGDGADSHLFVWNSWWFATAISEGHNPFETTEIFWPLGTELWLHTLSPWNAALALPLAPVLGYVGAYNFLVIASFALSGWAAHLLARDVTRSTPAAYVAGFAFTFTPYHFAHALGHLNLVAYYWLPFAALAFRCYLRERRRRHLAFVSCAIVGAGLTDLSLLLLVALFLVALAIGALGLRGTRWLAASVAVGAPAALVLSPYLAMVVLAYFRAPGLGGFGGEAPRYSLDVLSYVVPSPLSTAYRHIGTILTPEGTTTEASVFLGIVVLVLMAIAVRRAPRETTRPWLVAGGAFYVLSLGPWLQIAGYGAPIPLPYGLFRFLPLFDTLRTPARFALGVVLCAAVLAAIGFAHLRWSPRALPRAAVALAVVIALEAAVLPFPMTPMPSDDVYRSPLLAGDVLVELPLHQHGYDGYLQNVRYLGAQTIHGKPIVNGYQSRELPRDRQFLEGELVLSALWRLERGGVAPESRDVFPDQDTREVAGDLLAARGIRTLLFHEAEGDPEDRERAFLATLSGVTRGPTLDGVTVYSAEPTARPVALLDLEGGWHGLELDAERPYRWTYSAPEIVVTLLEPQAAALTMMVRGFVHAGVDARHVDVELDGRVVASFVARESAEAVDVPLELGAGTSTITLRSREGADVPAQLGLNGDVRPLALAVSDVRLLAR